MQTLSDTLGLAAKLHDKDVVIIGLLPSASGFQKSIIPLIKKWTAQKEVILCHFGNPGELKDWDGIPTLIEAYTDKDLMPKVAAQIIFGGMSAHGVLPMSISDSISAGFGIITSTYDRLSYSLPEAAGMSSRALAKIESIAREAIEIKATPGCRVLVAKDGKVVYDRSFGWQTYENKIPVTDETIYDLASLTKVSATLQAVMFMQEKGLIDINKKVSVYLPELKGSNKKDLILKDILTHQGGLWPFLPFWAQTMKDSLYLPEYYSQTESADYPFQVSKNLFASRSIKDSLWQWIMNAKIVDKPNRTPYDYRYSDMAFYMMQHLAEKLLNQPMQDFLEQNIYEPIGAYTTGYLPLRKFPENRIAPTEDDKLFRKSLLTGMYTIRALPCTVVLPVTQAFSARPMIWRNWVRCGYRVDAMGDINISNRKPWKYLLRNNMKTVAGAWAGINPSWAIRMGQLPSMRHKKLLDIPASQAPVFGLTRLSTWFMYFFPTGYIPA